VIREFWRKDGSVDKSTWALGWDTPSPEKSSAGQNFSSLSVGHLGYTGCSIWIDLAADISIILLTNRVHPSPENKSIKDFRPALHDLVRETLEV
jgi:CubicO group peptidase (beta-lactamase class C family)